MKISKLKINIILISSILLILTIILSVDNGSLNSLFINYEDNFIIKEVNIGDNNHLSDKPITLISNNIADTNNWVFPVRDSYTITTYYSYSHRAIDIYSYRGYGSDIVAANNGTVSYIGSGCTKGNLNCNGKRGNYIVINHNNSNYYTVYMHLSDIMVNLGDTVSGGTVIGTMGNTGNVIPVPTVSNPYGGTHLHFCVFIGEPYNGGYAINPFEIY